MTLVLRDATLIRGGDDWRGHARQTIVIDGDLVTSLGPEATWPADARVLEASRLIVMPAFVNAHTHSPEMLGRGLVPMAGQVEWLGHAYGGGRDTLDDDDVDRAIRLCAADIVRGGGVAVTDHFRQVPLRPGAIRAAARAWARTGLQANVAINLRDRVTAGGGLVGVPLADGASVTTRGVLAVTEALLDEDLPSRVVPGPSAPQRVTDDLLRGAVALARDRGSFVHMHVCECREDAETCRALYGESAVAHLDRIGVLGPDVELVHSVHIDDDDIARIAARGARIVHSPIANLRLGSGVAPIGRALKRGVDVRLSTDGAGSNDSQSMLEAVKFALLAPRACLPRDEWPTPEQVLRMATGGAQLAAGARADLIAFDATASAFVNAGDALAGNIALAARDSDLVHVMGGGSFLMQDGRECLP